MSQNTLSEYKATRQFRELRAEPVKVDEDARTIELAFSSPAPVRRWFGDEVLDHSDSSVRMGRLNGGAAVLVNHDPDDQVGVVESARVDSDDKGRAVVRFGRSARASEIFQDVTDGIRQLVSVGYQVHDMVRDGATDDGDVYRVTDWEPFEVSIVSVPADTTVGVGRSDTPEVANAIEDRDMSDNAPETTVAKPAEPAFDAEAARNEVRENEIRRIRGIESLGRQMGANDKAAEYVRAGKSVDDFIAALDDEGITRQAASTDIGLTEKETRSFSVCRLLLAMADPSNRGYQKAAAFELEASAAAADEQIKAGIREVRGAVLPAEVMRSDMREGLVAAARAGIMPKALARTLTAGTSTDGAELVATDLLAGNFIDVLRNRLVVMQAGAMMLTDLQGDIAIPRKTSGSAGGWISTEGGNAVNSEPQFDQVTMTPKTVGAYVDYSRNLLLQSSIAVEAMVRMDLAAGIATTIDLACLYGSGSSGQPTGIANTSGINDPTDFAGADPTFAEVVAMETAVAVDNADMGALAYITDAAMRGAFKTTEKASGTAQFIWEPGNTVNGYPCYITNQVTDGDVFFGNWSDLLVGTWGGLDILVDPYTNSLAGTIRVVAHQSTDLAVRHPVSFAHNNDGA